MDDRLGGFGMSRCIFPFTLILLTLLVLFGCADDGTGEIPEGAVVEVEATPYEPAEPWQAAQHTYVLCYLDILIDCNDNSIQLIEDLTVIYHYNLIPFLNQPNVTAWGFSFEEISLDASDPSLVQVDFKLHNQHPFPTVNQYNIFDFMGVIITDGEVYPNPQGLRRSESGIDLVMTNADGYTRWGNKDDFTTELIFSNPPKPQSFWYLAQLNPFKYYAKGLGPDDDLWGFLESGSNNDGLFQSGDGRAISLEFPNLREDGILLFGYTAVCSWRDQGPDGPYTPSHRKEAIACSVNVTDDIYYSSDTDYGGNLILDFSLWAWEEQPSVVMVESTVLSSPVLVTDLPISVSENISTYHLNVTVDQELSGIENHEFWIIAESSGYDYILLEDVKAPDDPLTAYFRYPLHIADEPYNENKIP